MSPLSKRIALALPFMLMLAMVAPVAAPPGLQIHTPAISPTMPGPNDQVTVNVTVTPGASVQNVSIHYTTDSWKTSNTTVQAVYNATSQFALAHIPPQYGGGHVEYYVVAYGTNGNEYLNNNSTSYYRYTVAAPTSIFATGLWIEIAIVVVVIGAALAIGVYSFKAKKPATN